MDDYTGLQKLPSNCHHHVNETFLVGNADHLRPVFIVCRNEMHANRVSAKHLNV